jgi:hypothetical protein
MQVGQGRIKTEASIPNGGRINLDGRFPLVSFRIEQGTLVDCWSRFQKEPKGGLSIWTRYRND